MAKLHDFVSDDHTVTITGEEFAKLKHLCPSIPNVRRMVRSTCRSWLLDTPAYYRKQNLIILLRDLDSYRSTGDPYHWRLNRRMSDAPISLLLS
jgi:hypothetical protein